MGPRAGTWQQGARSGVPDSDQGRERPIGRSGRNILSDTTTAPAVTGAENLWRKKQPVEAAQVLDSTRDEVEQILGLFGGAYNEARPVAVRLRFRIRDDKKLALGYFMNDPKRVAREGVAEVVAKLEAECGVTVMHGRPA